MHHIFDRGAVLFVALAAALWASDPYFRPALAHQLSASQIVLVEDALITLCFLPAIPRVWREAARLSLRDWLALGVVALGAQAFATSLAMTSNFFINNRITYREQQKKGAFAIIRGLVLFYAVCALGAVANVGVGSWIFERTNIFPVNPLVPFASIQHGQLLAALSVLGAVFLWACGTVFGRYALSDVSFVTTGAMRFGLALPALFILNLVSHGPAGFSGFSLGQIPSFLGIALIPGLLAMLLYYRALSRTPASLATVAELAYPCTLFLVFSLPAPVGLGAPLQRLQIAGAILLVAAVTALNVVKRRDVIRAPRRQALMVPTDEVA